jgi:hypothetical protein
MKDDINRNPNDKLYAKYYNTMRSLKSSVLLLIKDLSIRTIS